MVLVVHAAVFALSFSFCLFNRVPLHPTKTSMVSVSCLLVASDYFNWLKKICQRIRHDVAMCCMISPCCLQDPILPMTLINIFYEYKIPLRSCNYSDNS